MTVAIPTYNRPDLLKRALSSIAIQNYKNIEVIVSDNNTNGLSVNMVVASFVASIKNLKFIKLTESVLPEENFMGLLSLAKGNYFMWLADDDVISDAFYISSLVAILEKNPDAVTAFANWKLMSTPDQGIIMQMTDFQEDYWLFRTLKFIYSSTDNIFYGLHRIDPLRNARLPIYWPINRGSQLNRVYPFILDLIIKGKVIGDRDESILWINHDYTDKEYENRHRGYILGNFIRFILRRFNIYYIYCERVYGYGGFLMSILTFSLSFFCIFRDVLSLANQFMIKNKLLK